MDFIRPETWTRPSGVRITPGTRGSASITVLGRSGVDLALSVGNVVSLLDAFARGCCLFRPGPLRSAVRRVRQ